MNCKHEKAIGKENYCRICGMELGFKPEVKKTNKWDEYYCCKECSKT